MILGKQKQKARRKRENFLSNVKNEFVLSQLRCVVFANIISFAIHFKEACESFNIDC